jgi:hypothetical protein
MVNTTAAGQDALVQEFGAVLFGLLTAVIATALVVVMITTTDILPTAFFICFLLPVGAVIVGLAAGAGIPIGLRLLQARPSVISKVAGAALGLLCFALVYYVLYQRTYVDEDYEINYNGNGYHISEFVDIETGEPITFGSFMQLEVEGRRSSFIGSGRRNALYEETGLGTALNWVRFALEGLGLAVGGFVVASALGEEAYCARCRRYMKSRELASIPTDVLPALWEQLGPSVRSATDLSAVATAVPKAAEGAPYVRLDLAWCEQCKEANLLARSFTEKSPVGFIEANGQRRSLPVSPFVVDAALASGGVGRA